MIHYISPYCTEGNYGKEINRYMELVHDDDWVVITDGDAFFLTPAYGHIIANLIRWNPDAGIITCYSNRVGKNHGQRYLGEVSDNPDMRHWRNVAIDLQIKNGLMTKQLFNWITGVCMIISKKTWQDVKFHEVGILNVDKDFSKKVLATGRKVLLAEGLFIYHYYRLDTNSKDFSHLILKK